MNGIGNFRLVASKRSEHESRAHKMIALMAYGVVSVLAKQLKTCIYLPT